MNEKDEDGRSLPEELTADDVGRTILRRALPDDLDRIRKLFWMDDHDSQRRSTTPTRFDLGPLNSEQQDDREGNIQLPSLGNLWSDSSIVLLLCRAIAPHEDPPLGCAILSKNGFSMEKGRVLYLIRLASEPHLPRERFIERLQAFAAAYKCSGLEDHRGCAPSSSAAYARGGEKSFSVEELTTIAMSHLKDDRSRASVKPPVRKKPLRAGDGRASIGSKGSVVGAGTIKRVTSPLQSVQEESEVSESSVEKRSSTAAATKRSSKPSKRSRFA